MSSIGQSCGVTRSFWAGNPWTSGTCSQSHSVRSAPPARRPAICSEPAAALLPPQELQASEKAENKARGCIFTSACCVSSSPSQAVEEVLAPAPARFSGLLGGAWQKVRAMFRRSSGRADAAEEEPKAESIGDSPIDSALGSSSSTEVAATAPANAPSSPTSHRAECADAADLEKSEETDMPDARLNYTSLIKLQYCSFGSHDVSNFSTRAEL